MIKKRKLKIGHKNFILRLFRITDRKKLEYEYIEWIAINDVFKYVNINNSIWEPLWSNSKVDTRASDVLKVRDMTEDEFFLEFI